MDLARDLPADFRSTSHGDNPVSEMRSVDAASISQRAPPKKDKGKRKANPESKKFPMRINVVDNDDGGSVLDDTPKYLSLRLNFIGKTEAHVMFLQNTHLHF